MVSRISPCGTFSYVLGMPPARYRESLIADKITRRSLPRNRYCEVVLSKYCVIVRQTQ